jgi:hypothetical protein
MNFGNTGFRKEQAFLEQDLSQIIYNKMHGKSSKRKRRMFLILLCIKISLTLYFLCKNMLFIL